MKSLIFSHITKTGGSSIENCAHEKNVFWGRFDVNLWMLLQKISKLNIIDPWHIPCSFCLHEKDLQNYLNNKIIFTIVRNPYERIISEYFCRWGNYYSNKRNKKGLNDYIKNFVYNFNVKEITKNAHLIPQHFYVFFQKEKIINHVLKYENINYEFKRLMNMYDLKIQLNKKINTSNKFLTVHDLDKISIDIIKNVYYLDFIYFKYDFDIFCSLKSCISIL